METVHITQSSWCDSYVWYGEVQLQRAGMPIDHHREMQVAYSGDHEHSSLLGYDALSIGEYLPLSCMNQLFLSSG